MTVLWDDKTARHRCVMILAPSVLRNQSLGPSAVDLVGRYSMLAAPTGKTGEDEVILIHSVQLGLNYNF